MSFFGGMPFPVQFFLAFVIVLGLIGATAWAVRRFGAGRIGGAGLRGRQPRLAVVDYASVDGRRRLILVRRDNVEHLVMIGGPTDVVVEPNIVRAAAAGPRDAAIARPAAPETLPRAIPLPDSTGNGSWPLQPEPAAANGAARAARSEPVTEEPSSWPLQPHAEAPARPHRDTLAALADELSVRPVAPPRNRAQASARPHAAEPRQEVRQEARQEPRSEPRPEPRMPAAPPAVAETEEVDQSLAEMAHRLEAALRKPSAKPERNDAREPRPAPMPRAAMPAEQAEAAEPAQAPAAPAPAPSASARSPRAAEAKPPRAETKQPSAGKALYDSLEQEMASLLGRPTGKH
jgi:flagellar protein FliO/FliZ